MMIKFPHDIRKNLVKGKFKKSVICSQLALYALCTGGFAPSNLNLGSRHNVHRFLATASTRNWTCSPGKAVKKQSFCGQALRLPLF